MSEHKLQAPSAEAGRSRRLAPVPRTYLFYFLIATLLIGMAAALQISLVFQRFEPHYLIVPTLLTILIGMLMSRIALLSHYLRQRTETFRAVADMAQEFIYVRRMDGRYEYISPSCLALTGHPPEAFLQTPNLLDLLIHVEDRELWKRHIGHINSGAGPETLDLRLTHRDGSIVWVSHICAAIFDADGRQTGIRATNVDISQRKSFEDRIERMAYFDPLTDLPNRHLLDRSIRERIDTGDDEPSHFAVLFLDLDRFKNLNDSFGHAFGDQLLYAAADRLQQHCAGHGLVARFGGDEFVILLDDPGDSGTARMFAASLLHAIDTPFVVGDREVFLSGAIGIAEFPQDGPDAQTLIRNADAAMYHAKRQPYVRIGRFSASLVAAATAFVGTENRIRKALEAREFTPYYQPQVEIATGRIIAIEALARWKRPDGDIVLPDEFIPVAEEIGLIVPLGRMMLEQVCAQVGRWKELGISLPIAVNVSPRQLSDPHFPDWLKAMLERCRSPAAQLTIEVTEQVFLDDLEGAVQRLAQLRALGLSIALDDFGTGFSSLSYLKHLPIDTLKIDRAFTAGITQGPRDVAVLRAVLALCRDLNLAHVIEGIETRAQRDRLLELGCERGQGFLYHRPLPAADLEVLLRDA